MQIDILARPANTITKITFARNEEITAEGGSMVAMSGGLDVQTTTHKRGKRGIARAVKRAFAGENIFLNHYKAERDGAHLYVAPNLSGDIMTHELQGSSLCKRHRSWRMKPASIWMSAGKALKICFLLKAYFG